MKVNANTLRPGNIFEYQGKIWAVVKIQMIQPGKGGAFIQVDMRDVFSGTKTNERFRTQESIERVRVDEADYQCLYKEGKDWVFMNLESYEQITLTEELIGYPAAFLQDDMKVILQSYEDKPISVALPSQVVMEITEADPVIKGQTVSSSYKPALLENGLKILVPPHIEAGTKIVVSTEDGSYIEKAKK